MWSYIIDGVLILAIVICAIVGLVKGFFDSLLSLLGTGIAFAVSVFLAKYVSGFLNKIINIEKFVLDKLDATNEGTVSFFGGKFNYSNTEVAKFCAWIVTVIVLFLIIKLLIYFLSKIFESVTKNSPTISGLNRLFGLIFGIAKGGVWVAVALSLCCALSQVPVIGSTITDKIAETKVTSYVYKYVDDFVEKQLTKETLDEIISKVSGTTTNNNSNTETSSTPATEA